MYKNANVYLDRKFELSKKILEIKLCEKKIKDNYSDVDYLLGMYTDLKSWIKVADKIGVSRNGLYKHIRQLDLPKRKWISNKLAKKE